MGGASEFYVRSNFAVFYPIILLLATSFKIYTFKKAAALSFSLAYLHLLIGAHFLLMLLCRFFKFSFPRALFVASICVFSYLSASVIVIASFYFLFSLFPLLLFACLSSCKKMHWIKALLWSFFFFNYLFAGYLPLSLFGIALSIIFALCYIWWINPENYPNKVSASINMLIPAIIGVAFSALGVLAIVKFVGYAASDGLHGIDYSAYSLSESIRTIASVISFAIPSDPTEHHIVLGLITVVAFLIFLGCFKKDSMFSNVVEERLFKFSIVTFVLIFLLSFAAFIALPTLFYYLVPGLGRMHGYNRYFIFGMYFYAIFISMAYQWIINARPIKVLKIVFFILLLSVIALSFIWYGHLSFPRIFNFSYLMTELVLTIFIIGGIILFDKNGAWWTAIIMVILAGLPINYFFQDGWMVSSSGEMMHKDSAIESTKIGNILLGRNKNVNNALIGFFQSHSNKAVIKNL